jgi:hypothetical protein
MKKKKKKKMMMMLWVMMLPVFQPLLDYAETVGSCYVSNICLKKKPLHIVPSKTSQLNHSAPFDM